MLKSVIIYPQPQLYWAWIVGLVCHEQVCSQGDAASICLPSGISTSRFSLQASRSAQRGPSLRRSVPTWEQTPCQMLEPLDLLQLQSLWLLLRSSLSLPPSKHSAASLPQSVPSTTHGDVSTFFTGACRCQWWFHPELLDKEVSPWGLFALSWKGPFSKQG